MRGVVLAAAVILAAPAIAAGQPEHAERAPGEATTEAAHDGAHHDPTKDFNWWKGLPFEYKKLDVKGGPLGDAKLGEAPLPSGEREEPMSPPFVLMVLNFILLLFILARYGGPAARKVAESRSDAIKTALDEAASLRDQARAKLDEYSRRLESADAEMTKMIEGMRVDAEEDRKRVIAAAEVQAAAFKKDAEERIAAEIDRARFVLAREVATASATAAEQIIRETATAADQSRLVDGFIAELGTGAKREERT